MERTPSCPGLPPYNVRKLLLDEAREAPGQEFQVPGSSIVVYSDGVLDKCFLRVNSAANDAIPLRQVNPYYHERGFERFWVESDAQSGKVMTLLIQRDSNPGSGVGEMQKVGLYLQSQWAVRQGIDKTFYSAAVNQAAGESTYVTYTPGVGKSLYIEYFTASCYATAVADADKDQIAFGYIKDNTDNTTYATIAGSGGWHIALPTPVKIPAEHVMVGYVYNMTNHNCEIRVVVGGYEINE